MNSGDECATDRPETCEYIKRAPQTRSAFRVWSLIEAKEGLIRHEPMSGRRIGLDWSALVAIAPAWGVSIPELVELAGAIERGLIFGPPKEEMLQNA